MRELQVITNHGFELSGGFSSLNIAYVPPLGFKLELFDVGIL